MSEVKRVHENLKQLTFTKTDDPYHPLHVRIQTPDGIDVGLWLDRWQTVDTVGWLHQHLVSSERVVEQKEPARIEKPISCIECGSTYLAPGEDPPRCRSCADGL